MMQTTQLIQRGRAEPLLDGGVHRIAFERPYCRTPAVMTNWRDRVAMPDDATVRILDVKRDEFTVEIRGDAEPWVRARTFDWVAFGEVPDGETGNPFVMAARELAIHLARAVAGASWLAIFAIGYFLMTR